jgi:hypothetical protein
MPGDYAQPPKLVPLFPTPSLTPRSKCGHKGALRRGSSFVCMVCHKSGKDHLAYFQDAEEEPTPADAEPTREPPRLTSKERRDMARLVASLRGPLDPDAIEWLRSQGVPFDANGPAPTEAPRSLV